MTAIAVSAIFISMKVCEEGKPPATDAIFTSCAERASLPSQQTGIGADGGNVGYVGAGSFEIVHLVDQFPDASFVSILVREVRSMKP